MKIPKPFLLLVAVLLAFGALTPPHARAQVTVSFFYDSLSPYGEWVSDPGYGYCWHPTNVDENWAPYTDGYWAYTDSGWTWVSYEDYGGVVYHYGRWAHIPGEGWVWVPGDTWAPAWVSWRVSDDYVGWAPLPPEARWNGDIGFSTWVDARFDIGPGFYSFVGVHDFGAPALGSVIINREQNVNIFTNTTNITNITVNNSNVYTGGPSYAKYSALSSRAIPTLKLVRHGDASAIRAAGGKILSRQQNGQLMVLSPKISGAGGGAPPKVAKTLTDVKADHGWDAVKDPQEREKLHAQIKEQAGSDTTTPAKPVKPQDLKLVSEKIKTQGSKTALAESSATPKSGKSKSGKKKTTDLTALENAPATEEPGASPTPKKAKGKKSKTPSEFESGPAAAGAEETPIPKKSKKAKTPSDYESNAYDSGTPKRSKPSSDSNLQPFMSNGDQSSEPKSRKSPEEKEPKSSEGGSYQSGYPASQAKTPKGGKASKKQKQEEQGSYPPGQ